jgi:threonine/homoserine/homoserine lactone efflux protein
VIVLAYLLIGLSLGAGSSVLPGSCGLAVMNAASREGLRRAIATGVGAAVGDVFYATLGILGVGPFLASHPALPPILQAASGAMLVGYGVHHLRARGAPANGTTGPAREDVGIARCFVVGLATLLGNAGAMLTWIVIVGSVLPRTPALEAWMTVAGIGAGSASWFSMMAVLTHRGRARFAVLVARLATAVSCLLVASGVVALVRAGLEAAAL